MSDRPRAEATEAPDLIVNPYREAIAAQTQPGRVYHPEAEGLTGEALDKLMMSRYTEGVGRGRQEAFTECQPKIATAFDQGVLAGQNAGWRHGREALIAELRGVLGDAHAVLNEAAKRSRNKDFKKIAREAAGDLVAAMARVEDA